MSFTKGLPATLVPEAALPELRGTALGVFNLATGIAILAAWGLSGALWDGFGPQMTFLTGASFALLAMFGTLPIRRRLKATDRSTAKTNET